jgi:hypothetical protein
MDSVMEEYKEEEEKDGGGSFCGHVLLHSEMDQRGERRG